MMPPAGSSSPPLIDAEDFQKQPFPRHMLVDIEKFGLYDPMALLASA
jgi:hypothetical protein